MSDNQEIGRLLLIVSSYLSDGSVAYPVTAGEIARSNALDAVMGVRNLLAASPKVAVVEPVAGQFAHVEDMRLLIARLSLALKKINPDHELPAKAIAYLQKHGLIGSHLRTEIVEQVSDDKRDAALAVMRCPDCMGPVGEDHSESCGLGIGPVLWAESSPFATTPPQPINYTGDAK